MKPHFAQGNSKLGQSIVSLKCDIGPVSLKSLYKQGWAHCRFCSKKIYFNVFIGIDKAQIPLTDNEGVKPTSNSI